MRLDRVSGPGADRSARGGKGRVRNAIRFAAHRDSPPLALRPVSGLPLGRQQPDSHPRASAGTVTGMTWNGLDRLSDDFGPRI